MNILVTGANGQLGCEIKTLSKNYTHHTFFYTGSTELDITNADFVNSYFQENRINLCINCAAYTAVDKAEEDIDAARLVNANGVKNLATACKKNNLVFVHISTDYVFDGTSHLPLLESSPVSPINMYGQTKWEGEEFARNINPKTFIFRTSWVYSSFGKNFVKTMLKFGSEREKLSIIFDQIGTPTYAKDLAQVILTIALEQQSDEYGTYHYSNEGVASWYDFALEIFVQSNIPCQVTPIETYQYPTPAKRPFYSVLNKAKFKKTFNLSIPHWKESLKICLAELKMEEHKNMLK